MLDTAPEYQLYEPQSFMSAKAYKTKIAEPLISKLKALVKTVLARCFEAYLVDIDKQAEDLFSRLVKQMSEREGVTEQLKADNQMEWVTRMNNIRSRATEIVNNNLIYT